MAIAETFSELQLLLKSIAKWAIVLIILAGYFFTFGLKTFIFFGKSVTLPWFSDKTFVVQVFEMMRDDLVPKSVSLIVSNPITAFLIEMKISFFMAFAFSFPFILWGMLKYFSPALKSNERSALYKVVVPTSLLFFSGCVFAYLFVIPVMIRLLYGFTYAIHASAFFNVDDFISLAFGFMAVTGLMFLLPVIMFLTSAIGIIPYEFWKRYWRHALFIFTLFSAVITPDGTGITMIILMIPLIFLYVAGLLASRRYAVASNWEEASI